MKEKMKEDEYNWKNYTAEYSAQVDEMEETAGDNGSDFLIRSVSELPNGELQFRDKLHGNWKEIYSMAYKLKPSSIYECGCGGMYHLKNMKKILPQASIHGCDLLASQIHFGAKKFRIEPDILSNVSVRDFCMPEATDGLAKYDFVYCHAVVMHIAWDKAVQFVRNMTKISNRHIFLVEGTAKHDYRIMFDEAGVLNDFDLSISTKYRKEECYLLTKKNS